MTEGQTNKQGHATLDLPSRDFKAMKIARLLGLDPAGPRKRLLEIGCGSGGISYWFGNAGSMGWDVDAVDVEDVRLARDGYRFARVDGVELPFADAIFDVVITNHVIEHVGDTQAQMRHLSEIHRVLKRDGVGYLAVPNRWMLTEPHFRLRFLSWWPHSWRTPYLKLMGKGDFYDCEPLQLGQLERMLAAAGFQYRNLCIDATRQTFEIERPDSPAARVLRRVPDALIKPFKRIIPTLIYSITPNAT